MKIVDYPRKLSVNWLKEMYRTKAITPLDVMHEIIQRANEDKEMNIWITPPSMQLIKPYLDQLESMDPVCSPLWGIPFAIKDNIDLAGVPTTAGCPEYVYTPNAHAAVVERLIAAGAIPIGKTNLDQFATGLVGTRSPYGETHNALQPELISGGSSSGSAVAVARGQAVFALGTDTAGSGRVPAALNDLVGYKSSLGAWPTKGVVPACESIDCVTVFAHSLPDTLVVDRCVRGVEDMDPWSKSIPHPQPKLPQKIYLSQEPLDFFGPYANEYRDAWDVAVKKIKSLNIPIEYIDSQIFTEAAAILYEGPWVAERWADLGYFIEAHPGKAFPVTEQILRSGAAAEYDAASVFHALHKLQSFKLAARKLLHQAVLVMPTCGGTWTREQVRLDPIRTNRAMGRYTNHCNLLDLCAVAVPSVPAANNLPFGITWFALAENEDLICGAADVFMNSTARISVHDSVNDQNSPSGSKQEKTLVAVCGLHMRGYPMEAQMLEFGAKFVREDFTAAKYKMVKLPTVPAKPGLIKQQEDGASIQLELWEMPFDAFGLFAASIPAPLGIGKIELINGEEVPGFICEAYAAIDSEDISVFGGWSNTTIL